MRGVLETRALPPARAAEGEQSSNVLWALACLHADERHAQALSIQMGPAGITHLFLLTNYLQLLMHGQRDDTPAGRVGHEMTCGSPSRPCPFSQDVHTVQRHDSATLVPHSLVCLTRPLSPGPVCPNAGGLWTEAISEIRMLSRSLSIVSGGWLGHKTKAKECHLLPGSQGSHT